MGIPHPIPYQGSKRALAGAIMAYLPEKIDCLVEPFAGSAAVSLATAHERDVARFVLNDVNGPLIDLWEMIINHPQEIAGHYGRLWEEQKGQEREYYDWVRDAFNQTQQPEYLFYLLARCVKASVRYNSQGQFNQSPDNRRSGAHPATVTHHVLRASHLLRGRTTLIRGDCRCVLEDACTDDVIYMDPPYQGVCGRRNPRYSAGLDYGAFTEALEAMNRRSLSYIISYDGRTGDKTFGQPLPGALELTRIELHAGRSSQATLLNRSDDTYESLYLSPALVRRLPSVPILGAAQEVSQPSLFTLST